jgi:hypothetical protein
LVIHVARIREVRDAYKILVGISVRKRRLGRLGGEGGRWEDNIKIDLKGRDC